MLSLLWTIAIVIVSLCKLERAGDRKHNDGMQYSSMESDSAKVMGSVSCVCWAIRLDKAHAQPTLWDDIIRAGLVQGSSPNLRPLVGAPCR